MRYLLVLAFFLLVQFSGYSQKIEDISIDNPVFRFGQARETSGIFDHTFYVTNSANQSLIIKQVYGTCGCLIVKHFNKEILPGATGEITVSVDPSSQIGRFSEVLKVNTNIIDAIITLKVEGYVLPSSGIKNYNHSIGSMLLSNKQVNFGYMNKGDKNRIYVPVSNNGKNPVSISLHNVPDHIDVFVKPVELEPEGFGVMEINYYSSKIDDWDFTYHQLNITVEDMVNKEQWNGKLSIAANIREDFSAMISEDSINAPVAVFKSKEYKFGTVEEGDLVKMSYTLRNNGKNDLYIRKVKPSCGCTVSKPDKTHLKSNEETEIQAIFNTAGYRGKQKKGITVITNDPINYKQYLWLEGEVKPKN
ncbi:MAG: DUF1573 domain-containing protein [Bacteroidales bacterium]|nr:DUF1573 domain-containing protein [Bacteroidales bacterium]